MLNHAIINKEYIHIVYDMSPQKNSPIPLTQLLTAHQTSFHNVLPARIQHGPICIMDFTAHNKMLADLMRSSADLTTAYLSYNEHMAALHPGAMMLGRYAEPRVIYQQDHFQQTDANARTVHLGIDCGAAAGTPVSAPLAGHIHSFANNAAEGDYGPTIILAHRLDEQIFYTLYGHLSVDSLPALSLGQAIRKGEVFAKIGTSQENGAWPSHLHFQLIDNMMDYQGDFPGVAPATQLHEWLARCPDPNIILQIAALSSHSS